VRGGPILVTGATGNPGGAATRSPLAAGMPVRVAGTNVERLRTRFPHAEPVSPKARRHGGACDAHR
jgi:uncharacterized protein YbjT (DUF2867 family)